MNKNNQILKFDKLGKEQASADQKAALLREYEGSGMSERQFAKQAGVKYSTFRSWLKRKPPEQRVASPAESTQWIEAVVEPPHGGSVEVEVPGGIRLRLGNKCETGVVVDILRGLGYSRSC